MMSKINWYVGMKVYIIGYIDCKVYTMDVCPNASKPIEIECKLKNGELRYLDCTLDGRTDENMTTQNVFFESFDIPESAKTPKRWRAERGKDYFSIGIHDGCVHIFLYPDKYRKECNSHYEQGNYFRTCEEAETMVEKIKQILKGE